MKKTIIVFEDGCTENKEDTLAVLQNIIGIMDNQYRNARLTIKAKSNPDSRAVLSFSDYGVTTRVSWDDRQTNNKHSIRVIFHHKPNGPQQRLVNYLTDKALKIPFDILIEQGPNDSIFC